MIIVKIGRSRTNDCIFTNQSVSATHAILFLDDDGQHGQLKDLGSTNGTFVNDRRITADTKVSRADRIRFGTEHTSIEGILAQKKKTRIQPSPAAKTNSRTIGRTPDNQIIFAHSDVSQKHARLYRNENGEVVIEDCNSTNGTYVNGVKVTSRVLHQGDKVTITRNYPLAWETYFPARKPKPQISHYVYAIAAVLVVAVLGVGGYLFWNKFAKWDQERIYEEYSSAVCMVYIQSGYTATVNGENMVPMILFNYYASSLYEQQGRLTSNDITKIQKMVAGQEVIHFEGGTMKQGMGGASGTAFFIDNEGRLATNLHITRPWLYTPDEAEMIETLANNILSEYPEMSRAQLKVEGVLGYIGIIPNGLPETATNLIACTEVSGYDDSQKDVAIIQTESRALPSQVKKVIDISNADTSEEALKAGKKVFTIGFPYGTNFDWMNKSSNNDITNQVHAGSITQNRGKYEFGHDAATAGGASGSPILNDKGRLIGVHHSGMTGVTGAQGFNGAIKVKHLVALTK